MKARCKSYRNCKKIAWATLSKAESAIPGPVSVDGSRCFQPSILCNYYFYARVTHDREWNIGESRRIRILGQTLSANSAHEKEIKRKIDIWWSASEHGYHNSNIPLSKRRKGVQQPVCVLPVLTHCSETWHLTEEQEGKLRGAHREMERKKLGVTWRDRKQTTWMREETTIKMKKFSWAGRIVRRTNTI